MADNFRFDLTGVPLDKALEIAFTHHRNATCWKLEDVERPNGWLTPGGKRVVQRLVFGWTAKLDPGWQTFPAPMDAEAAESFVRAWLKDTEYGNEPDHDGDNGKGWRVYNEAWGHVGGDYHGFVAIEPVWMMYGK